jgi:hypothetical protein
LDDIIFRDIYMGDGGQNEIKAPQGQEVLQFTAKYPSYFVNTRFSPHA